MDQGSKDRIKRLSRAMCRKEGFDPEELQECAPPREYQDADGILTNGNPGCYCWRNRLPYAIHYFWVRGRKDGTK